MPNININGNAIDIGHAKPHTLVDHPNVQVIANAHPNQDPLLHGGPSQSPHSINIQINIPNKDGDNESTEESNSKPVGDVHTNVYDDVPHGHDIDPLHMPHMLPDHGYSEPHAPHMLPPHGPSHLLLENGDNGLHMPNMLPPHTGQDGKPSYDPKDARSQVALSLIHI